MINEIQQVREAIERDLVSARLCSEERLVELSPCGRYELEVNCYATADLPAYPTIAVAVIRGVATGEMIAAINRNDDRCFHAWVTRDGHDYFLLPEDLEGQTVIDLSTRKVASFSSPDDPFIWTEFHPSPDKMRLAIIGCYWACPFQINVYDFREPLNLPLPTLAQFVLPENNAKFGEWISAHSLTVMDQDEAVHTFDVIQVEPA
jgi:hypothetical protein